MIMTSRQRMVLARVIVAWRNDRRYRAADHGERVTLASLYRHGVLMRHVRRGDEGEANAAYEYEPSTACLEAALAAGVIR